MFAAHISRLTKSTPNTQVLRFALKNIKEATGINQRNIWTAATTIWLLFTGFLSDANSISALGSFFIFPRSAVAWNSSRKSGLSESSFTAFCLIFISSADLILLSFPSSSLAKARLPKAVSDTFNSENNDFLPKRSRSMQ